ncbi:MAG: ferrous-iron efflux pump FieF [Planctomycetota bacterium]
MIASVLAVTKLAAAVLSGSVAVLSSLADSLSDVAASGLALWTVEVAHRPADEEHRFGHGRAEALSSLVQAALVAASGVFVLYSGIFRFIEPRALVHTNTAIGVMVLSMAGSAWIVAVQTRTLRRVQSVAIQADSLHYKGDLAANASVILAILISDLGGLQWFDPLIGGLVATYLFFAALSIIRRSVDQLMDRELSEEVREEIGALIDGDPDTRGFHDLRTRSLGTGAPRSGAHIELHLELDGHLDLIEAHDITDRVEQTLHSAFPRSQISIHTEPFGLEDDRLDHIVQADS